ncbi:MAG: GTP-binding protein [Deltaproteobacteria bacterium]|nr:GTP-binding protein [Deltaproteobacteria bacterium]
MTFILETPKTLNESCLQPFIPQLPFEMFRIKGPVRFEDRTVMVNFVGGHGNWAPWEDTPETQLAFIGWNVNPRDTLQKIKDCVVG